MRALADAEKLAEGFEDPIEAGAAAGAIGKQQPQDRIQRKTEAVHEHEQQEARAHGRDRQPELMGQRRTDARDLAIAIAAMPFRPVDLAYLPGIAMTSVNVCSANKGNWESPLLGEPPAIPFPERTKGWVKTKAVGFLFLKSNRTSIYNGTKPLPKASGFSPGSQAGIWERRFYFFKRLNRYDCLPITSNNCNYQIRR